MWQRNLWLLTIVCAGFLNFGACTDSDTGKGDPNVTDPEDKDDGKDDEKDDEKNKEDDPPGGFLTTCERDKDCDSGLCIDNLKGETVCSVRCEEHDDCDDPDYRCSVYDSQGSDTVRACLPLPPTYCASCATGGLPDDGKCQGYGSRCVDTGEDGYHCGRDCSAGDEVCPPESECQEFFVDDETIYQCVPSGGRICSDCVDRDGDGYGVAGDNCPYEGFDCDDSNPDINPGAEERCDDIDWNCDGDPTNGFDLAGDPNHCGGCEISCHRANMEGVCHDTECGFGACDDKYYDLDGDWMNGCEYHCPDEDFDVTDIPDDLGTDTNCDGISGDIDRAVFVSSKGDDDNPGTKELPVRTLKRGQQIAVDEQKTQILVSSGNFELQTSGDGPFEMIEGISIYGGYNPDTWARQIAVLRTNLRANASIGMSFVNIGDKTTLSGVTIYGDSYTTNGTSSIAVHIENSGLNGNVELREIEINAGNGGTGVRGKDGINGQAGGNGQDHTDTNNINGVAGAKPGPLDCWTAGGDGGRSHSEDKCSKSANDQGKPGSTVDPNVAPGIGGTHGDNNCDWGVGSCGGQKTSGAGGDGGNGNKGLPGPTATMAANPAGVFNGANFTALSGGDGNLGTSGSGGGGGGGAGTAKWLCGGGRAGTGGAGGGGGGCSGTGGTGGSGGGGSFGVVINNSVPAFYNVNVRQGRGGKGGAGGIGGLGGEGGSGGKGSIRHRPTQTSSSHGKSGDGGQGGQGGTGSSGAGGCGGPSIGFALIDVAENSLELSDVFFTVGAGGEKGEGGKGTDPQAHGSDGCEGLSAETHSY